MPGQIAGATRGLLRRREPPSPSGMYLRLFGAGLYASRALPTSGEIVIGRSADCDVQLDDPAVSRRHARLHLGARLRIEDLGSANGTFLGERRLDAAEPVDIVPGELIVLGNVLMMVQGRFALGRPRRFWSHDYFEGRLSERCAVDAPFILARIDAEGAGRAAVVEELVASALGPDDAAATWGPARYELMLEGDVDETQARVEALVQRLGERGATVRRALALFPADGKTAQALLSKACLGVGGIVTAARGTSGQAIVIEDEAMQRLHLLIDRVARGTISVLLLGETGVGKEILAEALHARSPRAARPLLRLNCASLSETLLESELFGHEKGSFTGAAGAKPGLLETADGGTVFLDEVGELPMPLQVKLLRVIEERKVTRVGGLKPIAIDVRFVSATNRDLESEVEAGRFRRDLYFRLNGMTLQVPPLRERRGELRALAASFLVAAAKQTGLPQPPRLSDAAWRVLEGHAWTGNIRELKNVIERAVLLQSDGVIGPDQLPLSSPRPRPPAAPTPIVVEPVAPPEPPPSGDDGTPLSAELRRLERQRILDALTRCAGNQTQAARLLGISRGTLVGRLDAYGVPRPRKARSPG